MSPIICPTCGRQHPAAEGFCQCGYPLYVDDVASGDLTASHNPGRLPGESGPAPIPQPERTTAMPQPPVNHDPGPMVMCPAGHPNEPARTLCSVCGLQLGQAGAPQREPVPEPIRPRREISGGVIAALVAAAVIVAGGAVWALTRPSDDDVVEGDVTSVTVGEPDDRAVVAVDLSGVSAAASSVLPDDGATSYGPANTLDGDLATAWNSHSRQTGSGEGETLTYTFASPIDLARIELINGYTKSETTFQNNSRIAEVEVVTDTQTFTVGLHDSDTPQTIEQPFGVTGSVTIRVLAIYLGDGWENPAFATDLALSEISFFRFDG